MPRVLVADDDESLRRVLRKLLERAGYEVEEAGEGSAILEAYRTRRPDVVLTDLYMPGTDGVEALIRLRSEFPGARVIAMSGGGYLAQDEVLALAERLGAQRTLRKPIERGELLQALEEVLG
jgi:CheY-like chemotaxis protein